MDKPPPAKAVAFSRRLRWGLQRLERKMVPPPLALLDFVNDFWGAHIVYALAELELVDAFQSGSRPISDVASELEINEDLAYRLLRAATNLDVVREEPGRRFSLTPIGQALCKRENESFRDFIILMGRLGTRMWSRLADCVRQGRNAVEIETGQQPFEFLIGDENIRHVFNRAMTAVSSVAANALTAAYDFTPYSTIVDVGGGEGRLLSAILQAVPNARGLLFDLPEVVKDAPNVLQSLGVSSRCETVGGSFFESVPAGGDLYLMKAIIHDWNDENAQKILATVRRAMDRDSPLLLYEAVVPGPNKKHFAKYLDIEMIVMAGGRERTAEEYTALLDRAGFQLTRIIPTAGPASVIESRAR
ncbi:MAG: methyltransferase [Polyangiales bacterium]